MSSFYIFIVVWFWWLKAKLTERDPMPRKEPRTRLLPSTSVRNSLSKHRSHVQKIRRCYLLGPWQPTQAVTAINAEFKLRSIWEIRVCDVDIFGSAWPGFALPVPCSVAGTIFLTQFIFWLFYTATKWIQQKFDSWLRADGIVSEDSKWNTYIQSVSN